MIDCGEDSLGVLKLAKDSPWFYTAIGNHEDMLLSFLNQRRSQYHSRSDSISNGGHWINDPKARLTHVLDEYVPWLKYTTIRNRSQQLYGVISKRLS